MFLRGFEWSLRKNENHTLFYTYTGGLTRIFKKIGDLEDIFWGCYFSCSRSQGVAALVSQSVTIVRRAGLSSHSRKQRLPWTSCANLQLCDKQRGGSEIGCRLNFEDLKLDELKKRTGPPDRRLWSLVSFNWWQMKQLGGSWCFYRVSQKKFLIEIKMKSGGGF